MTKKQSSWIWFIMAVLPIAITIISYTNNTETGNIECINIINKMGFIADYDERQISNQQGARYAIYYEVPEEGTLEGIIYKLQNKLMPQSEKNNFIPQYIAYLIRLYIIKIAFDVFLLLPKICNRLINKAIGSGEIE